MVYCCISLITVGFLSVFSLARNYLLAIVLHFNTKTLCHAIMQITAPTNCHKNKKGVYLRE